MQESGKNRNTQIPAKDEVLAILGFTEFTLQDDKFPIILRSEYSKAMKTNNTKDIFQ